MTTTSIKELIAQRNVLDEQIHVLRKAEKVKALADVKNTINEFNLTQAEVFGSGRKPQGQSQKPKVPAKFRDPETGKVWSGRGITPKWIAGKDLEQFRIVEPTAA